MKCIYLLTLLIKIKKIIMQKSIPTDIKRARKFNELFASICKVILRQHDWK